MSFITKPAEEAFDRKAYPDDAIFFFDFDGVLATQCEEKIFRLPEKPGEREMLEERAQHANVDDRLYPDTGYLRHLVYQGYAFLNQIDQHHEAVAFAEELTDAGEPFHIITARSGYWAVKRMYDFLEDNQLYPQETFCLGRSSKAQLLSELRKDWPDRPFVFFEDSQKHIDACVALNDPLLTIVRIDWDTCTINAEYLLSHALRPLEIDDSIMVLDIETYGREGREILAFDTYDEKTGLIKHHHVFMDR